MKKLLYTSIFTALVAISLAVPALADIAVPTVFTPRGYIPILVISAAAVAVVVIIVTLRRAKKSADKPEDKEVK